MHPPGLACHGKVLSALLVSGLELLPSMLVPAVQLRITSAAERGVYGVLKPVLNNLLREAVLNNLLREVIP